jgi:hypothetical protein
MGDVVKIVTACYDNVTLMHVHLPPLVVTLLAGPEVNLGAVREMAVPKLKVLLEPVRRALVRSRGGEGKQIMQQQQQQQQIMMMQQQQQQQQRQAQQNYQMMSGY